MRIVFFLLIVLSSTQLMGKSMNSKRCDISEDKKKTIVQFLCGEFSNTPQYKFKGFNCAEKSFRKKSYDSAIQVETLKLCNEADLAMQFEKATIIATRFYQDLYPCVKGDKDIDTKEIYTQQKKRVSDKMKREALFCNKAIRHNILSKRQQFLFLIKQSKTMDFKQLYTNIGIEFLDDGSVVEINKSGGKHAR